MARKTISKKCNEPKKIIRVEAKNKKDPAVEEHAWCRRCADDGRQLWNGCLDEDVLLVLLGREMRMLRGLMLCCVTGSVRRTGGKAVVGRRPALCARCCLCWKPLRL
ncbi:hypothetical protein NQZ68_025223 [Dissostichus eleginoides]|nr:hypothetical protein NQZ68_025223 [Dissostichus eleginoides]